MPVYNMTRSRHPAGKILHYLTQVVELEFRTRSSKGGLGEGFDLLVIDEAQEYTDDQESAISTNEWEALLQKTLGNNVCQGSLMLILII
ncbi:MAG: hypothetical protein GX083_02280 [Clostridiales bacterium]|nr:hypothetical protein [Clostridiales bacterium]